MRQPVDADRLRAFMRAPADAVRGPRQVYLVGGATAVAEGWRDSTIDIDLALGPDADDVLRAIPAINRFPAIDPASFRRAVERVTRRSAEAQGL